MYQNLRTISPDGDAKTRFNTSKSWQFAASLPMISIAIDEVETLAAEYVVVFAPDENSYPMALLGVDGTNSYVTASGGWAAKNIPARLRAYPFAAATLPENSLLVRDTSAPHFDASEGQALFNEQGRMTPFMVEVKAFVETNHAGLVRAARLTGQLQAAGLLTEAQINVKLSDGTLRAFSGFKAIDEKALAAITETTRAVLIKSGAMALVDAHRKSLANFMRFIEVKVAPKEAAAKAAPTAKKTVTTKKAAPAASKASEGKPAAAKKAAPAAKAKPAAGKKSGAKSA